MKRRRALATGVAVAAVTAGAGVALFESRRASDAVPVDVWRLRFEQPGGGEMVFARLRGRPLLINFWATWCPPCVREMPLLDRFHRDQQASGWHVVGLAVDEREPVIQFLSARPVGFGIGLAGAGGIELSRALGNPDGALPFTVVFDRTGAVIARKLGAVQPGELEGWSRSIG